MKTYKNLKVRKITYVEKDLGRKNVVSVFVDFNESVDPNFVERKLGKIVMNNMNDERKPYYGFCSSGACTIDPKRFWFDFSRGNSDSDFIAGIIDIILRAMDEFLETDNVPFLQSLKDYFGVA